jgi:hypothetical protein
MSDWHPYSHGRQRQASVWIAALGVLFAFALGALTSALKWTPPWWLDTPAVFGFYGLLYWTYDAKLWGTKFFRKLHGIPDLTGKYQVKIRSSHDQHVSVHDGIAIVTQSWSRIVVHLETAQSTSRSDGAWLAESPGLGFRLIYTYTNTPKSAAAPVLGAHGGTAVVTFKPDGNGSGEYYSGRARTNHGELTFERTGP